MKTRIKISILASIIFLVLYGAGIYLSGIPMVRSILICRHYVTAMMIAICCFVCMCFIPFTYKDEE